MDRTLCKFVGRSNDRFRRMSMVVAMWSLALAGIPDREVSAGAVPDELIPGKVVVIKPAKLAKFVSRGSFALPLPTDDPSVEGARLRIYDTSLDGAGESTYDLPAVGWRGLGQPPGSKGYRYKGAGTSGDPCKVVLIKERTVKAVCKGADVAFAPPFVGDVGVILEVGFDANRYCTLFGGQAVKNDDKIFKRKDAPTPEQCPVYPPQPNFCQPTSCQGSNQSSVACEQMKSDCTGTPTCIIDPVECQEFVDMDQCMGGQWCDCVLACEVGDDFCATCVNFLSTCEPEITTCLELE